MTGYLVYDVFTEQAFGGNPLAIIPEAQDLPEADLQRIAREFNFSETVFVFPPEAEGQTARLRIFTPTQEVPFAGHPTIGTAVALSDLGFGAEMVLGLGVGPIRCEARDGAARFTTTAPLEIVARPDLDLVAAALGTAPGRIDCSRHTPVMASVGLPFTLSELRDRDTLAALAPDAAAFREGARQHPSGLDFAQFAYVREGRLIHARMFAPLDNIPEDPATGSAVAALAALLREVEGQDIEIDVLQGEDMGRPSRIGARAAADGVTISGKACRVMEGTLVYG